MNMKKKSFSNFPLGKRILIMVCVFVLLSIGVNAGLGQELVTCGNFDCATPSDFWSNIEGRGRR